MNSLRVACLEGSLLYHVKHLLSSVTHKSLNFDIISALRFELEYRLLGPL